MRPLSRLLLGLLALATVLASRDARAFCGFYVDTGGASMFADATRVVLLRAGTLTALSMQNNYAGPPEGFALVVPVPVVLAKENVRTLPAGVFDRVDRLSAPRLVEYWEQNPCDQWNLDNKEGGTGTRAKGEEGSMGAQFGSLVRIEAEFSVDEYDIVILSASDSTALERWLHESGYKIPDGAEPVLRPYVQSGSKFFVAKVNPKKVRFLWGRAALSPLRFHYDSPDFALPIRLGLINSSGAQDLIVHILAAERYEVANYENVTIPTNLAVADETRAQFSQFYAALFDRTVAEHPGAVVTEYAWAPTGCDPCPAGSGPLSPEDVSLLGGEVFSELPPQLVLTRLHARYSKDSAGEDLIFRAAKGIEGGRERLGEDGILSHNAAPSGTNAFQGRYIIRHAWSGPVECDNPTFGVWGGPNGEPRAPAQAGVGGALVDRELDLSRLLLDAETEQRVVGGGASAGLFARAAAHFEGRDARVSAGLFLLALGLLATVIFAGRGARARSALTYALLVPATFGAAQVGARGLRLRDLLDVLATPLGVTGVAVGAMLIATQGRRLRDQSTRAAGFLFAGALLPLVAGFVEAWRLAQAGDAVLPEVSGDLDTVSRVLASVAAEALAPCAWGAARSAALLLAASVVLARGLDAGARRELSPLPLVALGGLVAASATRWLLRDDFGAADSLAALGYVAAVGLVLWAARGENRGRVASIACAAVTAVLLLDVAARLLAQSRGLDALSAEAIDPSQRARIAALIGAGEQARLVLLGVDALSLVTLAVLAGQRARAAADFSRLWAAQATAGAAATLFALGAATWTGRSASFEALVAPIEHLSLDGAQSGRPAAFSVRLAPELSGPAVVVDESAALFATPGAGTPRKPYGPAIFDEMARAAGGSSEAPLLVASSTLTLESLLRAMEPLLGGHQRDYRLVGGRARAEAEDVPAAYAALLNARGLRALPIELLRELPLSPEPAAASSPRCLGAWIEGDRLVFSALERDAEGYHVGTFQVPAALSLEPGDDSAAEASAIERAGAFDRAVLALSPDADVGAVGRLVARLAGLTKAGWGQSGRMLFSGIVVSPSRAALEAAVGR